MSLAEQIVRLPEAPMPLPEPPRQRAPKRDPRVQTRRRLVASVTLVALWCAMVAAGTLVAARQAEANKIAADISDLQRQVREQSANNLDLQAHIVEQSKQERIVAWATAHGMHQPSAAKLQVLQVDKALISPKMADAATLPPVAADTGMFAWLGQMFQGVKGVLSAHQ